VSGEAWGRALDLRRAFDQAFAAPPSVMDGGDQEPFLMLGAGGDPFAVRVVEVAGFEKARRLLALPGAPSHLLGLAGLRGRLLPVFSLALLLGYPREADEPWLLVVGREEPMGLAFARFDGLALLPREAARRGESAAGGHVRGHVRTDAVWRGVIDLAAVREEIRRRAGSTEPAKEG
jgi:chemotaxis signal transduction protein